MTHEQPAQAEPTQEEILLEALLGLATPEGDEYTEVHLAPFGKPLTLPEPFAFELDTAPFL